MVFLLGEKTEAIKRRSLKFPVTWLISLSLLYHLFFLFLLFQWMRCPSLCLSLILQSALNLFLSFLLINSILSLNLFFFFLLILILSYLAKLLLSHLSSVQLLSLSDCLWLYGLQHARLPCPSPTLGACSNSCPTSWWCHPTISSSVMPFSCLQSFPALESFPMCLTFLEYCLFLASVTVIQSIS